MTPDRFSHAAALSVLLQAFPPPGFGGFPSGPGGWQPQQQQQQQPGDGSDASASGENGA